MGLCAEERALKEFYDRISWSRAADEELFRKRGLTTTTNRELGWRVSAKSHERVLEEMKDKYQRWVLTGTGLWVLTATEKFIPNPQYCGWGLAGRRRTSSGAEENTWADTYPPLLPYWEWRHNSRVLVGLRPHKGGPPRTTYSRPRLYVAMGEAGLQEQYHTLIITESEFKAAALWQMIGDGSVQFGGTLGEVICVGLPGIQMSRVPEVMEDLWLLIEQVNPERLVVAFDNEEKGDPALPSFKLKWKKRHDTTIYAIYLANLLERRVVTAQVAVVLLPDRWRDSNGKADWDGALAAMIQGTLTPQRGHAAQRQPPEPSEDAEDGVEGTPQLPDAPEANDSATDPAILIRNHSAPADLTNPSTISTAEAPTSASAEAPATTPANAPANARALVATGAAAAPVAAAAAVAAPAAVAASTDASSLELVILPEKAAAIAEAFSAVITEAGDWAALLENQFVSRPRNFIRERVSFLLYEPRLPFAGDLERAMVRRFEQAARRGSEEARILTNAFRQIHGYGYIRYSLDAKGDKGRAEAELYRAQAKRLRAEGDHLGAWVAHQWTLGMPAEVMDYSIECKFLVRLPGGRVERLVRLKNVVGEVRDMVILDTDSFSGVEKFRAWGLSQGNYAFGTGGRAGTHELNKLHHDINRDAADQIVDRIVVLGWMELEECAGDGPGELVKGLWFFRDCTVLPDGSLALPDKHGIIWHEADGYQLAYEGVEGPFAQDGGGPFLRPEARVEEMSYRDETIADWDTLDERQRLGAFYAATCSQLFGALGGMEGLLAMGSFISYAAAPEVFNRYAAFPGLWVHGQQQSGKSKLCEWLMHIWGFHTSQGMLLKDNSVSVVGMQIAADQYSNLPLWFDEFRMETVSPEKVSVLHNGFNRGTGYKKITAQRKVRTSFVVSGESTTNDAAARSRFVHIQASAHRRRRCLGAQGEQANLKWFNTHHCWFFLFGRYALRHREEFVRLFLAELSRWMESTDLKNVEEHRLRFVGGVAYSGFIAMSQLLGAHEGQEQLLKTFRTWCIEHTSQTAEDVRTEVNVHIFWDQVLSAFLAGEIELRCFKFKVREEPHPPGAPNQGVDQFGQPRPWKSYQLLIEPEGVISALKIFMAKQRATLPLGRKDYQAQLSKTDYWVSGSLRQRFGSGEATQVAWGVELDKHPLGYKAVSDEEYSQWIALSIEERAKAGDPRKSGLFTIIDKLIERESQVS